MSDYLNGPISAIPVKVDIVSCFLNRRRGANGCVQILFRCNYVSSDDAFTSVSCQLRKRWGLANARAWSWWRIGEFREHIEPNSKGYDTDSDSDDSPRGFVLRRMSLIHGENTALISTQYRTL